MTKKGSGKPSSGGQSGGRPHMVNNTLTTSHQTSTLGKGGSGSSSSGSKDGGSSSGGSGTGGSGSGGDKK